MQQNRINTLHHNANPLKQKRRCSNIPGRLHRSPAAQLAQELKIIPVYWAVDSTAIGTNSPCDESPAYLATSHAKYYYYYYYYDHCCATCIDIDECFEREDDCDHANGFCNNTAGSFDCLCNCGFHQVYTSDGRRTCASIITAEHTHTHTHTSGWIYVKRLVRAVCIA